MKYTLLLTFLLLGCNNSNSQDKTIATLKNNTWIDNTCNFTGQYDNEGNLHYQYFKNIYFFKDTYIQERVGEYSDQKCIKSINNYYDNNITYYNLGLKEIINDHEVYDIKIEINSIVYSKEKNGYYAIFNNKLCFSKSLYSSISYEETNTDNNGNQFTSTENGIGIYSSRLNEIDYNRCLIKKQ